MNIVTTGDSKFFHCLEVLCRNVKTIYNQKLIIYDIGLTQKQLKKLDARIHKVDTDVGFDKFANYDGVDYISATHKPFCVKQYFREYAEPMILIDADCLFMQRVEEAGFDIGVTLRPRKEIDLLNHFSGVLNSGVILFNINPGKFIERWIEECRKPNTTDQKALVDILSETIEWGEYNKIYDWYGLKVKVFNIETHNDYYLNSGKIFHFKGKRHNVRIYNRLLTVLESGGNPYAEFKKFRQTLKEDSHIYTKITLFIKKHFA